MNYTDGSASGRILLKGKQMALVDIGSVSIVATNTINSTVSIANMDDNKTVKNFYPLVTGFTVNVGPVSIINTGGSKNQYIFWS